MLASCKIRLYTHGKKFRNTLSFWDYVYFGFNYKEFLNKTHSIIIWAATWQNRQKECAPREDSDQPGYPPSLIRVFSVCSVGCWGHQPSSCGQRRLCSDYADAQADLSLRWAHMILCWFCHVLAHIYASIWLQMSRKPHSTTEITIFLTFKRHLRIDMFLTKKVAHARECMLRPERS